MCVYAFICSTAFYFFEVFAPFCCLPEDEVQRDACMHCYVVFLISFFPEGAGCLLACPLFLEFVRHGVKERTGP